MRSRSREAKRGSTQDFGVLELAARRENFGHESEIKMRVGVHPRRPERERIDKTASPRWGHNLQTQMYFCVDPRGHVTPFDPLPPPGHANVTFFESKPYFHHQ